MPKDDLAKPSEFSCDEKVNLSSHATTEDWVKINFQGLLKGSKILGIAFSREKEDTMF